MTATSASRVALTDPNGAFSHMRAHLLEKGVQPERDEKDDFIASFSGNSVRMTPEEDHLVFRLKAQSENALYFLREAVVEHVAEIDAQAAEEMRWSGDEVAAKVPQNFRALVVESKQAIMPGLHRLELSGAGLHELVQDGLHVKLMLPARRDREPAWPSVAANGRTVWPKGEDRLHVRYFTIAAISPETERVWIDVVEHTGGRVSDWALAAQPGDRIGVMGPGGGLPPEPAGAIVMVADLTALPAMARILQKKGSELAGRLIVAAPDDAALAAYLPHHRLTVERIDPESFAERAPRSLTQAMADDPAFVWVAAEHAIAQIARMEAKDMPLGQQEIVTYWRRGVRGDATKHED